VGDLQPLIVIVVGVLILGLVWKVVKGVIRFVFMLGIIAVVAYFVLNALR
jgi:hypothetical protein